VRPLQTSIALPANFRIASQWRGPGFSVIAKGQVAALIYADGGSDDASGVGSTPARSNCWCFRPAACSGQFAAQASAERFVYCAADSHPVDGRGASSAEAPSATCGTGPAPRSTIRSPPHAPAFSSHAKAAAASTSTGEASVAVPNAALGHSSDGLRNTERSVPTVRWSLRWRRPLRWASQRHCRFQHRAGHCVRLRRLARRSGSPSQGPAALRGFLGRRRSKLYNQAKSLRGRKKKDLYDRLKETMRRAAPNVQKRYGSTAAAPPTTFNMK